ncbi:MAG: hypothetical protein ACE5GI_09550 [Candidatus Aminicenantales bacterium]
MINRKIFVGVAVPTVFLAVALVLFCQNYSLYFFSDDFDRYSAYNWPSSEWMAYYNATSSGNGIYFTPGIIPGKSLKIHGSPSGCWEATAAREVPYIRKLLIKARVMRQDIQPGCHTRGCLIGLAWALTPTGADGITLFDLADNGDIRGFGNKIGEWETGKWYNVTIRMDYESKWAIFRINGYWKGKYYYTGTVEPYRYLVLNSGNGTSWFDDMLLIETELQ